MFEFITMSFEILIQKAYQIQSNPPQVHKAIFKSMKMLTNLLSKVGKIKRDGKKTHTFIWRKGGRMMWAKNKSTTPSLSFPFALNQNKTRQLFRKSKYMLWRIWNIVDMLNWISGMFPKCSMTQFQHVFTCRTCRRQLAQNGIQETR